MATSKLREKQIEEYLMRTARKHDGHAYKFTSPGRRGVPDRIVVCPCFTQPEFVEVKTETGKLSPAQVREIKRIEDAGGIVHVVHSKEDIDKLFSNCLLH